MKNKVPKVKKHALKTKNDFRERGRLQRRDPTYEDGTG